MFCWHHLSVLHPEQKSQFFNFILTTLSHEVAHNLCIGDTSAMGVDLALASKVLSSKTTTEEDKQVSVKVLTIQRCTCGDLIISISKIVLVNIIEYSPCGMLIMINHRH